MDTVNDSSGDSIQPFFDAEKLEMPIRDLDRNPYTGEDIRASMDLELRYAGEQLRMKNEREVEAMRINFFANRYFECMYIAYRSREETDPTGSPILIQEITGARRNFKELLDDLEGKYTEEEISRMRRPYIDRSDVCNITGNTTH